VATFSAWWTSFDRKRQVRQITWVGGPERVLVEEVVDQISHALATETWEITTHIVGTVSERVIWAELDQLPLNDSTRLVIVRNVEKILDWTRFISWVRHRMSNPQTFVILVSNEERVPMIEPENKRRGDKARPADHIAALTNKGHVIECRPFTANTAKHAVSWVQSKLRVSKTVAGHLLNRANGDLRLVRDVCVKLAVFDGEITLTTINEILAQQPRDSFANAMLSLDRETALLALEKIPAGDYSRVIGQLDSQLDFAHRVHDLLIQHKTNIEIARDVGKLSFLLPDVLPVAKHYDQKRVLRIRKLLAYADEAVRGGVRDSVLETVVLNW
jgi:DNA polymerase III delta subunit